MVIISPENGQNGVSQLSMHEGIARIRALGSGAKWSVNMKTEQNNLSQPLHKITKVYSQFVG
jgi:hypothetical protein